jgi:autotransporter translocation and assembly factor TamB
VRDHRRRVMAETGAQPRMSGPSKRFVVRTSSSPTRSQIRGPATDMRWSGAVLASREGELREVAGSFSAQAGRLDLLGNRFTIDAGEVTLPPDEDIIDPFIRVVAHTRTPMAEVTASLRGRLSRPTLVFTSLPVLTQSQILTLLLTGSPDANDADEQRVMAQAAALLATFESPQLASFLSSRVGIDHVGLGFGDDLSQPILSVGKRVSRKIYIETAYKVNAPARHNRVEARVEYQLAPRWTLETSFGDAAVGGLDVFWRAVFGVPKPRLEPTSPEVSPAPR